MVDSNVLLDIINKDPKWFDWSAETLEACAEQSMLAINPVIYSEVSIGFKKIEDLEAALPADMILRLPVPWEAAFLAGKCFVKYRKRGGARRSPLPDFFIGAHAAIENMPLITRDVARYRTYFPGLNLITP
jgi:predicted nucleic acid-binding protein